MARIGQNALVTLVLQWGKYLVQVLTLVVLSHLLSPHDYGLVAMVLTVAGLAAVLGDLGLSLAALQAPVLTQAQKSNLFWLNGLLGLLVGGAVAASANLLAGFYGEPALVGITVGLASVFALNGFSVQLKVDVNRKQRFVALGMIDLSGQVTGLIVAVAAALAGAGYWALVLQQVVGSLTGVVAAASISRWRPSLPSRGAEMRSMLRFGRDTLGLHIANYATTTIDSIVVGRQFGPSVLGLYNRAFQLVVLPLDQVLAPLTRVFIPRLSQLTEDGPFNDAVSRLQRVVVYGIVGPLGLLAVAAAPLLEVVLGAQWAGAGPLVRLLVLGGVFQALGYVYYWAFLARQRTKELFFSELWGRVPMAVLIVALVHLGVEWVAIAVAFGQALIWFVSTVWFAPRLGLRPAMLLRVVARPVVLFGVATAAGFAADATFADRLPALLHLAALVSVWAAFVGAGLLLSGTARGDVRQIVASVRPARG
jgi:O-antigen/teichoic acid export membrane protein